MTIAPTMESLPTGGGRGGGGLARTMELGRVVACDVGCGRCEENGVAAGGGSRWRWRRGRGLCATAGVGVGSTMALRSRGRGCEDDGDEVGGVVEDGGACDVGSGGAGGFRMLVLKCALQRLYNVWV